MSPNISVPSAITTSYDINLRPVCKEDIDLLKMDFNPADAQELRACYGSSVEGGLAYCVQRSTVAYSLFIEGKIGAMAGVEPETYLGQRACVWSWTSREIFLHRRVFWKVSLYMLQMFRALYPHLYAVCAQNYLVANRYIMHLGGQKIGKPFHLADPQINFQSYYFSPLNYERRNIWEEH